MARQKTPPPEPRQEIVPAAPLPDGGELAPAQVNEAAQAFLKEAKGPRRVPRKVPIIGIAHKEGQFILPSGEMVDEVAGYPVYYFQTRRYYAKPPRPGEKGTPPTCWSPDLLKPDASSLERQHETCSGCPHSQFGTARDGRSQSCGTYTWLFLLNPQLGNPPLGVVVAPPSSIRVLLGTRFQSGYLAQAAARHGVYEIVWTHLALEQAGDQVPYCILAPRMGKAADDPEKCRKIAHIRNEFVRVFEEMRGVTPEPDLQAG